MASDAGRLLLATRSPHKVREIRQILGPEPPLLSLEDAGIAVSGDEDAIEAFDTFLENALAKAAWFHRLTGMPTLADDSGICADALEGRPGVRSRRFSGTNLEGRALDHANNRTLLEALADVPEDGRTVRYVCAAVRVAPDVPPVCAVGTVRGSLLHEPRGQGGFGYDPLFLLPEIGLSFAQLDAAEKHRHSHRGRAFRALRAGLR